jgi:hypothetical protein
MGKQLTSKKVCARKHTYASNKIAYNAQKRRNKAAGYKYLRRYQCNICTLWHLTTQDIDTPTPPNKKEEV